jgi:hypothetical protein
MRSSLWSLSLWSASGCIRNILAGRDAEPSRDAATGAGWSSALLLVGREPLRAAWSMVVAIEKLCPALRRRAPDSIDQHTAAIEGRT